MCVCVQPLTPDSAQVLPPALQVLEAVSKAHVPRRLRPAGTLLQDECTQMTCSRKAQAQQVRKGKCCLQRISKRSFKVPSFHPLPLHPPDPYPPAPQHGCHTSPHTHMPAPCLSLNVMSKASLLTLGAVTSHAAHAQATFGQYAHTHLHALPTHTCCTCICNPVPHLKPTCVSVMLA